MNYLVDTQIFLWSLLSPKKISKKVKDILLDPESAKHISVITFWEISLKFALKKLDLVGILPDNLPGLAKEMGFEIFNLDSDTASSFYKLPRFKNKDPFDRMLAWQAVGSNCYLVTKDPDFADFKDYGLKTIW